jgi:hypothetical protein|tara:strand:- start:421 stop:618 length:198 start_codon:yes stop_codon:yes gene_type:complete
MRRIDDWHKKGLVCSGCGETRSVKYERDGLPVCNLCVARKGSDWYSDEHETLADRKFADSQREDE